MRQINLLYGKYVINASSELTPTIRISPFQTSDLWIPSQTDKQIAVDYLKGRFGDYYIFDKARNALAWALSSYDLQHDDIVTILTTSGNYYVSGCVTETIEKFCKWNREINNRTKVILVNHEFGYPYEQLDSLKKNGLPIIEDCAHTFVSRDSQNLIGTVGEYVIYSLPKYFPMQIGAILVKNYSKASKRPVAVDEVEDYVLEHLALQIPNIQKINEKRLENHDYLCSNLRHLGITPFLNRNDGVVPGVFLFKWEERVDYPLLKRFMQANGVESSVFYGENAFFLPCHFRLGKNELEYIVSLLSFFSMNTDVVRQVI